MTKYLIILACIVGVAGAANAQAVANLEITADGHAYLVFASGGNGQLTGYEILSSNVALQFARPQSTGDLGTTGQTASTWKPLTMQASLAGEPDPGDQEPLFFMGSATPPPADYMGEGNIDGHVERLAGTPIYIGKILASFAGADITFTSSSTNNTLAPGTVTLRTAGVVASTSLTGSVWRETGDIGSAALNVTHVGTSTIVADMVATGNAGGITTFGGHLNVDGTELAVNNADLVDAGTRTLRIQAGTAGALTAGASVTVAIDATLAGSQEDGFITGRWGTLGSAMVVSNMSGDFAGTAGDGTPNDVSDDQDIDAISAQIVAGGSISLLFDVTRDGAVDAADRDLVIGSLVARTGGNGTVLGDMNLDGKVSGADYTLWAAGFGPGTGWKSGDLNGDGASTGADYTLWAAGFGTGPEDVVLAPVAAPEPATMTLLAIGALGLVRRRRRA